MTPSSSENLAKSTHLIAYIEFDKSILFNIEKNREVYTIYKEIISEISELRNNTPHYSFTVKVFANVILLSDEIEYPNNEVNDSYYRHSYDRSIFIMIQIVSKIVKICPNDWNIRGFITKGPFFRKQEYHGCDETGNFFIQCISKIDFVWGNALVKAYEVVERMIKMNISAIFIDKDVENDFNEIFGSQRSHLYIKLNEDMEYSSIKPSIFPPHQLVTISNNDLNYIDCYVLHIDMLGTKNKINNTEETEENKWLNAIYDIYNSTKEYLKRHDVINSNQGITLHYPVSDFKLNIFSDNIIITYPVMDDNGMGLNHLITFAGLFQGFALEKYKWMCYGGITHGEIIEEKIEDNTIICGPGLQQSFEIEERYNHPPRIEVNPNVPNYKESLVSIFTIRDTDNCIVINYPETITMNENGIPAKYPIIPGLSFIPEMKRILLELIIEYSDDAKIYEKVKWAVDIHNKYCSSNKNAIGYLVE